MVRGKESKAKGYFFGILAAVSYGVNPLGAKYLYEDGVNVESVLFYRYALAVILIAAIMGVKILLRKLRPERSDCARTPCETFRVSGSEAVTLVTLGLLFVISSTTLYCSFLYMDSGVACTLLFIYPVMVAALMALLYGEKLTRRTIISILLSLMGVVLLYRGDGQTVLSTVGVLLVLVSSLSYAFYIILANRASDERNAGHHSRLTNYFSPTLHRSVVHRLDMSSMKLSFYVLLVGAIFLVLFSFSAPERHLMWLPTARSWLLAWMLAIVPTVLSLVALGVAVRIIGSTPTAVLGALEPTTAVVIGLTVFSESFTASLATGIALILFSVIILVLEKKPES